MKDRSPQDAKRIEELEEKVLQQRKNFDGTQRAGQIYKIPVVFHVIHDNGPENISDDVVENALEQLNTDFRRNNGDTMDIDPQFRSLADDAEIEFRIAQKDPDGNCHRGITRTRSDLTYKGNTEMKNLIQWDPSMYLNVWICNTVEGGAAGYALKPSGAQFFPNRDGIVLQYNYFGSGERTLTHETGHYLSLDHTWGSQNDGAGNAGDAGNCNYDDGINDTPNTVGWFHCNDPSGSSCGSQDNVHNYMEYSFCHRMFTPDQANAMRSALNSSLANRDQLWQNSNLQATGTDGTDQLCKAKFKAEQRMVCVGEGVQFFNGSYHGATFWNWDFPGGNPDDPNSENPTVTYSSTGVYDVSLTVSNSSGTKDTTMTDHIKVVSNPGHPMPFVETFDWPQTPINDHNKYHITDLEEDGVEWEWTDDAGEGGSRGSIMLDNFSSEGGRTDMIETTSLDASDIQNSNLELGFDVAYSKKGSNDDGELEIYASKNCGKDWNWRGSFSANQMETAGPISDDPFVPEDDQWTRLTLNGGLGSSYNVENLRLRFQFNSDGGNNIYIDNINVYNEDNVGIEENEGTTSSVNIYPNPVTEELQLEFDLHSSGKVDVEVRDLLGKKVLGKEKGALQKGHHRLQLDMESLEAGPYLIILKTKDGRSSHKVFKK